jgi:hypothetical protein
MNYIPISSIAKFIGKCKYSSFEKEFINILQSYHTKTFDDLKRCYLEEIDIYQPNVNLILSKFPNLKFDHNLSATQNFEKLCQRKRVRKFLSSQDFFDSVTTTVKTEKDKEEVVKETIKEDIQEFITDQIYDETVVEQVAENNNLPIDIVKSVAIKERGTVLETNTIDYLKSNTKYDSYIEQKKVYGRFANFVTSGKIDLVGLMDGDIRCVYEIKNRKSEYLHINPPEYDYIQLYCYIYLVGKKGKIVSQYDGDVIIHQTISKKVAAYEFENNIKPLLDDCIKWANKIIENKYSKETFELLSEFLN